MGLTIKVDPGEKVRLADKKWFRNLAIAEATVEALAAHRDEWNDALRVLAQAKLAELRAMRAAAKTTT